MKKMYSDKRDLQNLPDGLFNFFTDRYGTQSKAKEDAKKIDSYAKANGLKIRTKVISKKGSGYTKTVWGIVLK